MDLMRLPAVARRRLWLILAIALVTTIAVGVRLRTTQAVYEGLVRVQVTAPQPDDVALLNGYRSSNLRDDLTLARNNFLAVLRSREVRERTIQQLQLQDPDTLYNVEVRPIRDTDFMDIVVPARKPEIAEHIANTHVNEAIRYYGELRSKPATATRIFLAEQLRQAAEKARLSDNSPTGAASEEIRQARESDQLLLKKYAEVQLLEGSLQQVSYIQVVGPAMTPDAPAPNTRLVPLLALGLIGSVGLGLLVAVALDMVYPASSRSRSATIGLQTADGARPVIVPQWPAERAR